MSLNEPVEEVNESEANAQPTVEDQRHKNWWWVDNAVVDVAGPVIGASGLAVFAVLSRYADNTKRDCWPGLDTIRGKLGMSKPTVIHTLNTLKHSGLIRVVPRRLGNDGPTLSNRYILNPQDKWTLDQGKEFLLRCKESARQSKRRGKDSLPEQDLTEKDLIKKTTQQPHSVVVASDASLVVEMRQIGVSRAVAESLIEDCGAAACRAQIGELMARKPKDAAAVLVASIREGWAPNSKTTTNGAAPAPKPTAAQLAEEQKRLEAAAAAAFAQLEPRDQKYVREQVRMQGRTLHEVMWELFNFDVSRELRGK